MIGYGVLGTGLHGPSWLLSASADGAQGLSTEWAGTAVPARGFLPDQQCRGRAFGLVRQAISPVLVMPLNTLFAPFNNVGSLLP